MSRPTTFLCDARAPARTQHPRQSSAIVACRCAMLPPQLWKWQSKLRGPCACNGRREGLVWRHPRPPPPAPPTASKVAAAAAPSRMGLPAELKRAAAAPSRARARSGGGAPPRRFACRAVARRRPPAAQLNHNMLSINRRLFQHGKPGRRAQRWAAAGARTRVARAVGGAPPPGAPPARGAARQPGAGRDSGLGRPWRK